MLTAQRTTSRTTPVNIPPASGTFVGRAAQLAAVRQEMRTARLVTLHGPPGVGKTRLAMEVGRGMARGLSGRVWFVALGSLDSRSILVEAVATALGLSATLADPLRVIVDHVDSAPSVIVLDNCEHLREEVRTFTAALLERSRAVTVLATSRQKLDVAGERIVRIDGLVEHSYSDAVELFVDRARRVDPGFAIDEGNRDSVLSICRALEGIPLAIELATARLIALTPQQIEERLGQPFSLLSRSGGRPDPRSSLLGSIEASYEMCTSAEQETWRILSVLAGPFTIEDAAAVCRRDETIVLDLLQALLEKAIILPAEDLADHRRRYRMLFVLRAFGQERLDETADADAVRLAHAKRYAALGAQIEAEWTGPDQMRLLLQAEASLADVRAAASYLLDVGRAELAVDCAVRLTPQLWWTGGRIDEGRYWVERVLALLTEPSADRQLTLMDAAALALAKADLAAAEAFVTEGAAITEDPRFDSPVTRSALAFGRSFVHLMRGEEEDAIRVAEDGLAEIDSELVSPAHFRLRQLIAYSCNSIGDLERGIRVCEDIVALSDSTGETYYRAFALHILALHAWRQGDLDRAQALSQEGMVLSIPVPNRPENPDALLIAGLVAASRDETERAAVLFGAAAGTSRTRIASTEQYTGSLPEAAAIAQRHEHITKVLHPGATLRGYRMTPAEAIAFAVEAATNRPAGGPRVTAREQEVARLIANGATNRQIATALSISVRTAEGHVERLRQKLDVRSRVAIGTWYVRYQLENDASQTSAPGPRV